MNLTDAFIEEMEKRFHGKSVDGVSWEDYLYEDYAYVLTELSKAGVKTAKCDVWCGECEEESFNVNVNTETFEWTCPKCGEVDDQ